MFRPLSLRAAGTILASSLQSRRSYSLCCGFRLFRHIDTHLIS